METITVENPVQSITVQTVQSGTDSALRDSLRDYVLSDPIAALVDIQSQADSVETIALRELVLSVVGVPKSNISEMVEIYKTLATAKNWSASTVKVRASNLKGVLTCANENPVFADLIVELEVCGLQRAYAMRAEFLKAESAVADSLTVKDSEEPEPTEEPTIGRSALYVYAQQLKNAIEAAEACGKADDAEMLREMLESVVTEAYASKE